jgi:aspartate/methionine/tyrosine aminotransferase
MAPTDAAMHLIEKVGVASVPGDNFYREGDEGNNYLRFAFCRSMESLEEGVRRFRVRL